ncbi:hypothetical protein ACFY1L_15125 [Streptomyces sp. NPDC001663]|uniref:hypothetical protein n=1 Tax=Streptomyces sp. NPDC001663 TaxID=3364597 RepID=UPI0036993DA1
MRVDIAWWDLDGTPQTIDSLRADLCDEAVAEWNDVPGLRLKLWLADRESNRWGAVMVWEADRPEELPPNRAARLIGGPPSYRGRFDVQATAATSGDQSPCTNT